MQRWRNHGWPAVVGAGLCGSLLLGGLIWLTVTVTREELSTSDQLASVISAYVGICGVIVAVIGALGTTDRDGMATPLYESGLVRSMDAEPSSVADSGSDGDDIRAENLVGVPRSSGADGPQRPVNIERERRWVDRATAVWRHRGVDLVPHQLPAAPWLFTGRNRELGLLSEAVGANDELGVTVPIAVIGGAGGIGKTSLAVQWAYQNLADFPAGQLYVNLRGFDPSCSPMPPAVAMRSFLDALGVEPRMLPKDLEAQTGLFRSLVADRRILTILDNARDSDHVLPLLPGTPSCVVLVTSRHLLAGLVAGHGARLLNLDVLPDDDAREFLTRHLNRDRAAAESEAVTQLVEECAGLPLALRIVAARVAAHPDFPLSLLAEELRETSVRLDALDAGEPHASVRAACSWSYKALDARTATTFALMGVAPGPDIGVAAAASLAAQSTKEIHILLRGLEDVHLVQQYVPGRYRLHDLVRLYAEERTRDGEQSTVDSASQRIVDFYLHTAYSGERLLYPQRQAIELDPPATGCEPHVLTDSMAALAWFRSEHLCLLAAQQLSVERGWHTRVWQLAWTLNSFQRRQGYLHDHMATWRVGVIATDESDDPVTQALARRHLGHACARAGRHAEAVEHLQRALILAQNCDDTYGQAHAHHALGQVWEQQGNDRRALTHASRALPLFRNLENPVWEATGLNALGWYKAKCGYVQQGRVLCDRALTLNCDHRNTEGEAETLYSLGYIAHHSSQYSIAEHCYRRAIMLFGDLGYAYGEADAFSHLGDTYIAMGERCNARRTWEEALALYHAQRRLDSARRIQERLAALDSGPAS